MTALSRRTFLQSSAAAVALCVPPSLFALSPGEGHKLGPLGLELYTVRRLLKADPAGTLAKVAAVGYTKVECAGYLNIAPKDLRAALDNAGLAAPSNQIDYQTVLNAMSQALDTAHMLGHQFLVNPWIDEAVRAQPDGWKQAAEAFNRAGEAAHKAGIQFAYHNHWFEFHPMADTTLPYDYLLQACDPKLVAMEMDLCWVNQGGADPIAYFNRYPGRFKMVHVKDVTKFLNPRPIQGGVFTTAQAVADMTEVGSGIIDWKHIFAGAGKAGIQHYFIEHDEPKDAIASITKSYQYLSALRF
jgi:sugar phosphate isomerase/epimerase